MPGMDNGGGGNRVAYVNARLLDPASGLDDTQSPYELQARI